MHKINKKVKTYTIANCLITYKTKIYKKNLYKLVDIIIKIKKESKNIFKPNKKI